MANRRKTVLIAVGIVAIVLIALVLVVPALVNVDRYRPRVIAYMQEKTGKQVEIGRLGLTVFPLALHIDDFGVKNPPIFPAGYREGETNRRGVERGSAAAPAGKHKVAEAGGSGVEFDFGPGWTVEL
jgi:hypothetical protein